MARELPAQLVPLFLCVAIGCDDDDTRADASDTGATDTMATDSAVTDTTTTDTDTVGPDGCGAPGGAGPRFEQPRSLFRLHAYDTHRYFEGAVYTAAPIPLHVEAERQGHCRLLTYTPATCTPECDWAEVCVAGACRAFPEATAVGTITLTGASASPVTLQPTEVGNYFWDQTGAFAIDEVTLAATGGDLGPFSLTTCAAPELDVVGDWSALMEARRDGADVTLTWRDPAAGARFYIRMTTGIGTHGGISPVEVECEGPDAGALTIPGAYLDALYATGWSCGECGDNRFVRYHADEVEIGGEPIQLRVQSATTFWYRP